MNWVENGVEPDHFAISPGGGRTTKICMYPNETVYKGSGDVNDEANYECQVNRKEPRDLEEWADFVSRKDGRGKKGHGHHHGKGKGHDHHGKGHGHDYHGKKKGHDRHAHNWHWAF